MVPIKHRDGKIVFPESLVRALEALGEHMAVLTAGVLRARGLPKGNEPIRLPAAFLLEFAAVLQILEWEWLGLSQHLPVDLPPAKQALRDLYLRSLQGDEVFERPDAAPLSRLVPRIYMEHLAWEGRDLLGAGIALGDLLDEDAFVETLADLIWHRRHDLSGADHQGS